MKGCLSAVATLLAVGVPVVEAYYTRTASLFVLEEPDASHGQRVLHSPYHTQHHHQMDPALMAMSDLSELHQRVMGLPPRPVHTPLPFADFFHKPSCNLVFVVGGMHVNEDTPFFHRMHEQEPFVGKMHCDGMNDIATAFAGPEIRDAVAKEGPYPQRLQCVSAEGVINTHGLCASYGTVRDPLLSPLDMDSLYNFDPAIRDIFSDGEADIYFLSELQELIRLPTCMMTAQDSEPARQATTPDTYMLFSNGIEKLEEAYGRESRQVLMARRLLDDAVDHVVKQASQAYQGGVISEIVLTYRQKHPDGRRRLADLKDNDKQPTMEKIAKVNILTWTTVGLAVVLLLAINVVCSADAGPKDSLLYAKFQADTSGGKND